jgi:hypothetical protein
MKFKTLKDSTPRFLYSPRRSGSVLRVCRHLIIEEGPRRIVVQRLPYGWYSEPLRPFLQSVYVDRHQLDGAGWDAKWGDRMWAGDPLCPLGRLYRTEDAARFALDLWASTTLVVDEVDPASLN